MATERKIHPPVRYPESCYNSYMKRLYEQFIPEHYDIKWDLCHAAKPKRRITGSVQIKGTQVDPDAVRLHAKNLTIDSVYVNDREITELYTSHDELVIPHKDPGTVYISIEFSLHLTNAMHGIYPCYYEVDGKKQEVYATQFESHHAREAFPCIDEPEAKATYSVTLLTANNMSAATLSNMPIYHQRRSDDATVTTFAITPRMSSYLVAFAAGDFQRATSKTKGGVEVNVYATKAHSADSLTWALERATETIDFFNDYFGIDYPLPKSDHVALPDFSAGAMENWGLVTYREVALLADPQTATISGKEYIAEVISHELSHQWFGDLVTMKWWDDLWLNESFATVMEYLAPNALHPEWRLWSKFVTNEGSVALRRDSIDGVQPIHVEVSHPDEIGTLFDGAIVYAKGGRLLHMMQEWIGEDAFRAGLKQYFTTYQYKNTIGDDLWRCLGDASGKDVAGLMNTWLTQPGFPVVHATLGNGTLTLSQEQCFVGPHTPTSRLWPIPLDASDHDLPDIMNDRTLTVPYHSPAALRLNTKGNGHFVTHYSQELQERILSDIIAGKLSETERAVFLFEQTLLARGGYLPSAALIDILVAYEREASETVWNVMAMAMSELKRFVETDETAEQDLRRFIGRIARAQYTRLGWTQKTGEPEEDTRLRSLIIGCMLYSEDAEVIATALSHYAATAPEALDAELRSAILTAAVRFDTGKTVVNRLLDLYKSTSSAELQGDITSAVTSSRNPAILRVLIGKLTDTSLIRTQDTMYWFVDLLRNRRSRTEAWQWMQHKWNWIEKNFGGDKSHDYFPRYSGSCLATRQQLAEYKAFFEPKRSDQSLTRAIDMGIRDLEGKIELLERDSDAVAAKLQQLRS